LCYCDKLIDAKGLHLLSCKKSAGKIQRHSLLNDVIYRSLLRANIPAKKEPIGLCRIDGKRPDGVTIIPWSRGKCLTWDVTVPDTFAASHIDNTSSNPGAAADKASASKINKYSELSQTYIFMPIAVETSGVWNKLSYNFIEELGNKISNVTNDNRERSFLFQRLSVAIQRGNEICFLNGLGRDSQCE
jgi:hypothetical protein